MNNEHENLNPPPTNELPADRRPIGFWIRAVDRQLTQAFAAEFASDGIDRREWMLLNVLSKADGSNADDSTIDSERLARMIERANKRGGKVLRRLAERGWIIESEGTWTLTDEGRAQRDALATRVDTIRAKVAEAVSPDDYATTIASLESIARGLGWDGSERMPRGPRGSRGFGRSDFGRGRAHGFDHGHGHSHDHGHGHGHRFGPERGCGERGHHPEHGFGEHRHHGEHSGHSGHRRHGQRSEQAYERGFEAGVAAASRLNLAS